MKRLIYIMVLLFIFSCKKENAHKHKNELEENNSKIETVNEILSPIIEEQQVFNKSLLNGAWSLEKGENALFFIENDSIYYVDHQDKGYHIELNNNIFKIYYDEYTFKGKVFKLTKDSLIYQGDGKLIKLCR